MNVTPRQILGIGCSNYGPLWRLLRQASVGGSPAEVVEAPFGQVFQTLLDHAPVMWKPAPEVTIVWTQPHRICPAFARLLAGEDVDSAEVMSEVDAFVDAVHVGAKRTNRLLVVPSWSLPSDYRGRGCADWTSPAGVFPTLAQMNLRLAEGLRRDRKILMLNSENWLQAAGARATDSKLWMMGKIPFGLKVFEEAAEDICAAILAARGLARKVLVLDLDDTLWGGIVGEEGWEGLRLGGGSPEGEAFTAFQDAIKTLQRSGVLLALCSKNEEQVALEAIDRHPEMRLRRDDFAAWRINWSDKAQNLRELADELNLDIGAFVFIDDSPAERARVREAWPQVMVPDWPADPSQYAPALRRLRCFDMPCITEEDRTRTQSYVAERHRREDRRCASTLEEWLARIEVRVVPSLLCGADLPRAAQLLNKTNQFNLTTRRMSEADLRNLAEGPDHRVFTFRVRDRYGEYGLTGLASLTIKGETASILDFVMSCRVMGRRVEQLMMQHVCHEASAAGCTVIRAQYIPTSRNGPCAAFLGEAGFRRCGGGTWERTLGRSGSAGERDGLMFAECP